MWTKLAAAEITATAAAAAAVAACEKATTNDYSLYHTKQHGTSRLLSAVLQ